MKKDSIAAKKGIKGFSLVGSKSRTSNSYGRNLPYMRYRVLANLKDGRQVDIADLFTREELKGLSYWSTRSESMSMTCWGTSQLFEAQLALAAFVGMEKKGMEWSRYSRKACEFSKEI